ncbi:NAD-dependent epimerase/dehydratase family protein [Sporobolomyces koalae]|uniref:NAD-dependent epimerase/dehydratase family protein n=1 Tax=Sporobolomyces koalae TaxID=500713 RepID=UPI00316F1C03
MSTTKPTLFLVGTGFIGGTLLTELLKQNKYEIAALSRDSAKADKLKELGVRPVRGSLDDEVLVEESAKADIIIHTATADDEPSVKSILKGLAQRPSDKTPAIYIQTSGTGVLTVPLHPESIYFSDEDPEQFDRLVPDHAPHRNVDLLIKRAVEEGKLNARISIMLPPNIFGRGTGPFNKISIQLPRWIRRSIKDEQVTQFGPKRWWNHVHVSNLALGYVTLLEHIESELKVESQPPLYVFCETGEHQWEGLGELIHRTLEAKGQVKKEPKVLEDASDNDTETGTQSRAHANVLRKWGWKPTEKETVEESIVADIDYILSEEQN